MTTPPRNTVTTGSATEAQARFARDALRSQRRRLFDLFSGFDEETWTAPTRCTEWSVHEVVRHLCDVTLKWRALLRGASPQSLGFEGFDPRTTPVDWLERSATERPADTVRVFERASAELLDEVDQRTECNAADQLPFLYGTVPWSIVVLHGFWDAWLHERDIVIPMGRLHESPEIESRAAATYGLVMSCVPFALFGTPFDETVVLDGDGGGLFQLEARESTVTTWVGGDEDSRDPLRGALPDVVDSLLGRGPQLTAVLHGPAERVEALGTLRQFILAPVA
jgi:uncharacterized protein (TIGR03083 family)